MFLIDGIHAWTERLGRGFPHVWERAQAATRQMLFSRLRAHIGAEVHLPFGGVKHTGNGHREGNGALDFFTAWKTV
jgi:acyl-CoA reductase-like NAD-dependent aldehyde dehydrogenase